MNERENMAMKAGFGIGIGVGLIFVSMVFFMFSHTFSTPNYIPIFLLIVGIFLIFSGVLAIDRLRR